MNDLDTKLLIISELSNNINDLINTISINKSTYNEFSQKSSWVIIFIKNELSLPNIVYDDTSQWLILFKKEIKLKIYTNRLMDILEHPKIEHNELITTYQDISFVHILNVEGINMKEIYKICNKCSLDILNKTIEKVGYPTCSMYIEKEKYIISIYNPSLYRNNIKHDFYRYIIERDSMKQIFYNILSYGVIPFDQYTGDRVKLITKDLKTSYYESRTVEYSPIDHTNITINCDF